MATSIMAAASGGRAAAAAVKCGMGRLVAAADPIIHSRLSTPTSGKQQQQLAGRAPANDNAKRRKTRLVHVSHSAPTRLIPMRLSCVERAGAALCALSSYGGGMVQGDRSDVHVTVKQGATLGIVTQGSNRIYRPSPINNNNNHQNDNEKENATSSTSTSDTDNNSITCRSTLHAQIASDGFLVVAPDPCVAFSSSKFVQQQRIDMSSSSSSCVLVDWFGAGRVSNGERWDFARLSSRTTLHHANQDVVDDDVPFLVESVSFDRRRFLVGQNNEDDPFGFNTGGIHFNAFCSIILHGPQAKPVVARCKALEQSLASKWTRIRQEEEDSSDCDPAFSANCPGEQQQLDHKALSGRVLLGVSKIHKQHNEEDKEKQDDGATYVARLAATSNEDMYRILHSCLLPLCSTFGVEFYKDRIQASATAVAASSSAKVAPQQQTRQNEGGDILNGCDRVMVEPPLVPSPTANGASQPPPPVSGHAAWCAYMLADSGLPTGSFAHSAGIEAASQLGMFGSSPSSPSEERRVSAYILAATRSTTQLLTPFVRASHELVVGRSTQPNNIEAIHRHWLELDRYVHASMASNAPACRASLDQGEGMLRVSMQWLQSSAKKRQHTGAEAWEVLHRLRQSVSGSAQKGHIGPLFGIVSGFLGLSSKDACHVLGFCAARDMVSAAVRLNLVGPLASVAILSDGWDAVNDGYDSALASEMEEADLERISEPHLAGVRSAAGCSPIADAIHPCHDLLSVRLFRT